MVSQTGVSDVRNIAYVIDGEPVLFTDGKAERVVAPDAAAKDLFRIFGEPVFGDLDGDGDADAVMYLTRDSGGSGTFFYVIVAVNEAGVYKGTDAMFLGDRIAPQNINIIDGRAVVNFADRKNGEPFSVPPSVGKSVLINLDPRSYQIGEFVKGFEGEVDASTMTLGMKTWNWVRTEYVNGIRVTLKKADAFSLAFHDDRSVDIATDCNAMGGQYALNGNTLSFSGMVSTQMFCEGSQEGEFAAMLADVTAYHFTNKGELSLDGKDGKSSIILR